MLRLFAALRTLRVGALFFSAPYTLLWARSLHTEHRALGVLFVVMHACALLLTLALLTRAELSSGAEPRLFPRRDRFALLPGALSVGIPLLALALLAASVVLLLSHPRAAALAALFIALLLWQALRPLRSRYIGYEALAPFVLLVAPALLLARIGWDAPASPAAPIPGAGALPATIADPRISPAALAATCLGAAALGLFLLLCFHRDAGLDRHDRIQTTPTRLGDSGTRALLWLWLVATIALASIGVRAGWWGWTPPAIAGLGAALVSSALASDRTDAAVVRWALAHAALSVALYVSASV